MRAIYAKFDPDFNDDISDADLQQDTEFIASLDELKAFDTDNDNVLSFEEFKNGWTGMTCDREGKYIESSDSEEQCMCFANEAENEFLCEDSTLRLDLDFCVLDNM